jgi:hypothetical protein
MFCFTRSKASCTTDVHFDMIRIDYRYRFMLVLLAFAAYSPTLQLGFLWDDHAMIETNPHLRTWSAAEIRHDFTTDVFDGHGDPYYRPAQTLLNRIDFTLWKLRPFGYHLTNFLGHAANCLVVVELGILLGLTPMGAFLGGTLVAVHPIVVEQLMIVAGRAEIFGLLTVLLALYFLIQPGRRKAAYGYAWFVLALFFKESALIAPALLALCLWLRKSPKTLYWRILPCMILMLPYLVLRHHAVGSLSVGHDPSYMAWFFIAAFPHVLWKYLEILLFPWNLHSHRLVPHLSHGWPRYLIALLAAAGLLIHRRSRWGCFAAAWFVLCLIPKTPIMIFGNFMLEHWAYPALIGIAFWVGYLLSEAWSHQKRLASRIAIPSYLVFLIAFALMVHVNVILRGTDEKMYRWALNFTTSNPIRYNLGLLLLESGRPMEASQYFEMVRAYYPENLANRRALSLAYWQAGHHKAARYLLWETTQAYPEDKPTAELLQKFDAGHL